MEETFVKLIEFVEMASPVAWAAARQQVTVSIFQNILWIVVSLVSAGVLARVGFLANKKAAADDYCYGTDGWVAVTLACALVGIFTLFVAIACTASAMGMAVNPDYYAIQYLLDLFTTS